MLFYLYAKITVPWKSTIQTGFSRLWENFVVIVPCCLNENWKDYYHLSPNSSLWLSVVYPILRGKNEQKTKSAEVKIHFIQQHFESLYFQAQLSCYWSYNDSFTIDQSSLNSQVTPVNHLTPVLMQIGRDLSPIEDTFDWAPWFNSP